MLASLHVEARQRAVRRRPARRRRMGASRFLALALLLAVAAAAAIGFGYAGSGGAVPKGVRVDGVDVGGRPDWRGALGQARRAGDGPGPLQGFRRLGIRLFGLAVTPPAAVDRAALRLRLDRLARSVGRPHREAAIVLDRLVPRIVPGAPGVRVDRAAASRAIVSALAALGRGRPVPLPVERDPVRVTAAALAPALAKARSALSAPVRLRLGDRS